MPVGHRLVGTPVMARAAYAVIAGVATLAVVLPSAPAGAASASRSTATGSSPTILHVGGAGQQALAHPQLATAANTYTVNTTGNADDSSTADGICNDGTSHCSLRAAIEQANASTGSDLIRFSIGSGPQMISVPGGVPLPTINDTVTIDGRTQPGYSATTGHPEITIDGGNSGPSTIGSNFNGLKLNGAGDAVISLAIGRFNYANGIMVTNTSSGDVVENCYVGVDRTGTLSRGNGGGIEVQGTNFTLAPTSAGALSVLSSNQFSGIRLWGNGDVASGMYVGTSADGNTALNNTQGVAVLGSNITVGTPDAATLISGNTGYDGIYVSGTNALIQDSVIGTNAAGTSALPNYIGIHFANSGSGPGWGTVRGNLISGNSNEGIEMTGQTTISSNFIGTDVTGTTAVANLHAIEGGGNDGLIGGATLSDGNVISGNNFGVDLNQGGVTIEDNLIGTDASGTTAVPNILGARLIGAGSDSMLGNVVAGNTGDGIQLAGSGHQIDANFIGVTSSGGSLGNGGAGVNVGGSGLDEIGAYYGNTIAHNSGPGIAVSAGQVDIENNSISADGGLGIDLGATGVTANDALDADSGPNQLQNFPVLTAAHSGYNGTTGSGTLDSAASSNYRIDFYDSPTCDASGNGEGLTSIGTTNVLTNGSGHAGFTLPPTIQQVPPHTYLTATATDEDGNTSEFSACRLITGSIADVRTVVKPDQNPTTHGTPITFTIYVMNDGPQAANGVSLRNTIGGQGQYASITSSQGSCTQSSVTFVTCALGSIPAHQTATVTAVVTTPSKGQYRDTANAVPTSYDPNRSNNTSVTTVFAS